MSHLLKEDMNGNFVIVSTKDGYEIRKYIDHKFREYTINADRNSEANREMTWRDLPDELKKREAYDIVCSDVTDPTEPELREYEMYPLYSKDGSNVILERETKKYPDWKYQIWSKKEEDSFDKKTQYRVVKTEEVEHLKNRWEGKNASWNQAKTLNWKTDAREWHKKWEEKNKSLDQWIVDIRKNVKLLCDLLLENR
jgi:hypothetical protein